jgi:predicted ATPase
MYNYGNHVNWKRTLWGGVKMKIKKLHIENYKSLKNVQFDMNDGVNIFIGKNNSGKSNLIDALLFVSALMESDVNTAISNYGGFRELVFGKVEDSKITFEICFALSQNDISTWFSKLGLEPEIPLNEFKNKVGEDVTYQLTIEQTRISQEKIQVKLNGNDVLYAKGQYVQGTYFHHILHSFKDYILKGNHQYDQIGGSSPASPILLIRHSPIRPEENLQIMLYNFVKSSTPMSAVRNSPVRLAVRGTKKLTADASNLPQVLNSIASSNRALFEMIMSNAETIIEEIQEIRAPIIEGSSETYIATVEKAFKSEEFTWKHIASGTKEILYLVTLLHTTPKGSFLMIEEPEIHLHSDAIWKLLSLIETVCQSDDKQVLITTHSPTLIDQLPFNKIYAVTKEAGQTTVIALKDEKQVENMLFQAGIPNSWLLQRKSPSYLLIVEGRDDVKIWSKFLDREHVDPIRVRVASSGEPAGGHTKALEIGKFIKRARIPTPFKIIVDSDNKHQEKEGILKKEGFKPNEYHILSEKEIESYLVANKAISNLTAKPAEEVSKAIKNAQGSGKDKLKDIFLKLGFSEPNDCSKEYLAAQIDIPNEIVSLIKEIKDSLK